MSTSPTNSTAAPAAPKRTPAEMAKLVVSPDLQTCMDQNPDEIPMLLLVHIASVMNEINLSTKKPTETDSED